MGKAKEHMMEVQERDAVATALGMAPEDLDRWPYELTDGVVVWLDGAPDHVATTMVDGELVSSVSFDEPSEPDDA